MSANANFAASPRCASVTVTTANTNVDGTGTLATVFTAGASGSRIDTVRIKGIVPEGSTQAADSVRLYINDGANTHLFAEQIVAAGGGNVSTTVPNVEFVLPMGFSLPFGYSLKASTHAGGSTASYKVTAFGGDY